MADDIFATGFREMPYWWEAARPDPEDEGDPVPEQADVAIVGSGYGGLNAAIELARGGVKAVVLEAEAFGIGASTRSGGMVSGGVNVGSHHKNLIGAFGVEKVRELLADANESYEHLEEIIRREKIDCFYQKCGRFVGAHSPAAYAAQEKRLQFLNDVAQSEARMVPRSRQHEEIATDDFHGGMVLERTGGVHPALYHRGLLEAARRHGATLCAMARVEHISGEKGDLTVVTARGTVKAREVFLATNGYTGDATPYFKRRVIPVASYIIATEELGEARVRELFPTLRMIAQTKRVGSYFRPSPDRKRVIWGGRASFRQVGARAAAPTLYRFMTRVFPQIDGVKITHAWFGNVAFTFDYLPHMGERDGVHYALGCNGSGVVMMSYLGRETARKILGKQNRPCAFDGMRFDTMSLYNGEPWFLPMVGNWYRFQDWLDERRAG